MSFERMECSNPFNIRMGDTHPGRKFWNWNYITRSRKRGSIALLEAQVVTTLCLINQKSNGETKTKKTARSGKASNRRKTVKERR